MKKTPLQSFLRDERKLRDKRLKKSAKEVCAKLQGGDYKCRGCHRAYDPDKARAVIDGYCSRSCMLDKARSLGWNKGHARTPGDFLMEQDAFGLQRLPKYSDGLEFGTRKRPAKGEDEIEQARRQVGQKAPAREYVVRIVTSAVGLPVQCPDGHLHASQFLECLRYAGVIQVQRNDVDGYCFDLKAPPGVDDSNHWATVNAARFASYGYNAICAPNCPPDPIKPNVKAALKTAPMTHNVKEQQVEVRCPACNAFVVYWEEAQGWLRLADGEDLEFADFTNCPECQAPVKLPSTKEAEVFFDTHMACTCGADRTGPSAEAHADDCPLA